MEKQTILGKEVLRDVTLQKDLKEIKEALEIQKLKEEIIGRILLINDRESLIELAESLKQKKASEIKKPGNPPGQGNG